MRLARSAGRKDAAARATLAGAASELERMGFLYLAGIARSVAKT